MRDDHDWELGGQSSGAGSLLGNTQCSGGAEGEANFVTREGRGDVIAETVAPGILVAETDRNPGELSASAGAKVARAILDPVAIGIRAGQVGFAVKCGVRGRVAQQGIADIL